MVKLYAKLLMTKIMKRLKKTMMNLHLSKKFKLPCGCVYQDKVDTNQNK